MGFWCGANACCWTGTLRCAPPPPDVTLPTPFLSAGRHLAGSSGGKGVRMAKRCVGKGTASGTPGVASTRRAAPMSAPPFRPWSVAGECSAAEVRARADYCEFCQGDKLRASERRVRPHCV